MSGDVIRPLVGVPTVAVMLWFMVSCFTSLPMPPPWLVMPAGAALGVLVMDTIDVLTRERP